MKLIPYIDDVTIKNKRVLLRADFDVSRNGANEIADDVRIQKNIPTIERLLTGGNKVICVAKLDRPKQRDPKLSLNIVVQRLRQYLPDTEIILIDDFLTEPAETFERQQGNQLYVLENIRFYPEEKENNQAFAKKLADLADVYVNDAFAMCHRKEASMIGVPKFLPHYGGLLLKQELAMITKATINPKRPVVAIIGGAKVSTKLSLIHKLTEIADYVILGGGLANVFFKAQGYTTGASLCEEAMEQQAKKLLALAAKKHTKIILPTDVIVGDAKDTKTSGETVQITDNKIAKNKAILDIGPETKAMYGSLITKAHTIIWNGPVGLFENPAYRQGTDFIYYAIAHNPDAISIVGGGDTLAAISNKEYLEKLTHVSTGGGAMLELIEKGTLPAIEALR